MGCNKKKRGVLLLNMGGPDSIESIEPFLYNLFSDNNIVNIPLSSLLQKPFARFLSKMRAKKVAGYYKAIGGKSPIVEITQRQAVALENFLNALDEKVSVYMAMRYSPPFTEDVINQIRQDCVGHLVVLSLYPHYSRATSYSSLQKVREILSKIPEINATYVEEWYDHPIYIEALQEKIQDAMKKLKQPANAHIIFSAHGLPQKLVDEGDPYLDHINITIQSLEKAMDLPPWTLAFQSKLGPIKWIEPFTEDVIKELGMEGQKEIIIVPISFVSDHVETQYEIDILYSKLANENGIDNFVRVDSLNVTPKFIQALAGLVQERYRQQSG